jgi:hypothetical protein
MSKGFFANLEPLRDYNLMVENKFYQDLPLDWVVVLTDVKGSTKAIEAGRYKEVNMVGVSCIIAVQNALGELAFPFIFGGDGATLAVPKSEIRVVKEALSHTRAVARQQFGLELRIAIIEAAKIIETGAQLKVAKLQVSEFQSLALVRGDGWTLAESWMKDGDGFTLPDSQASMGDTEGLECRWNPIPARKDEILALIIQAREGGEGAQQIYRDILKELLAPDMKPITLSSLKMKWPPKFLVQEARMRVQNVRGRLAYLAKTLLVSMIHVAVLAWRGDKNLTDPIPYLRELTENTDYVKFDECLRMIIDVSNEQKRKLLAKLEAHYQKGEIYYGYHADKNALMTCYIQGPQKHIHFVDGGGGGYAMAAKVLKAQRRAV